MKDEIKLTCDMCPAAPFNKADYIIPLPEKTQERLNKKDALVCTRCLSIIHPYWKLRAKKLVIKPLRYCLICEEKHSVRFKVCIPTMTKDWLEVMAGLPKEKK